MNKLTILFAAFFSVQSNAQRVGIKAGLAFTTYSAESNQATNPNVPITAISTRPKTGFILGSHVDFDLSDNLSLRSGLEMVLKGSIEEGTYTTPGYTGPYSEKMNYPAFDFPVQLLYQKKTKGEQRLLLGGGIVPGILIETALTKLDLGAALLVGYRFPGGIESNLSYNHGLVNVGTNSFDYKTLKNRHFGITLGYRFRRAEPGSNQLPAIAQEPVDLPLQQPSKALFAELGGTGGFLSLNYDTRLTKSHKGWGIRFGFGAITDLNSTGFTMPFGLNYLSGERNHFFEMGIGATYFSFSEQNQDSWFSFSKLNFLAPYIWTGYRYQPMNNRFVFRAGFNQFVASGLSGFIRYPFPGFSFGYSLK